MSKIEHIEKFDSLNIGREKINKFAIDPANRAEEKSDNAVSIAITSNDKSDASLAQVENVQQQINTLVVEGDSSFEAAQARIAEDGQEYDTLKERLDLHNNNFDIADDFKVGGDVPIYLKSELETFKNKINTDHFNLAISTDLHYDAGRQNYKLSDKMLPHLSNLISLDGIADSLLLGGDNIDGYQINKINNLKNMEIVANKIFYETNQSDVFLLRGNHDDGSVRSKKPAEIINDSEFKKVFKTIEKFNNEMRDGDSLYFYKDYPDKKIRLIGLDSVDAPNTLDSDGNVIYQKQYYCGYQSQQLEWLANVALQNVPTDYHTMIVTHVHLALNDRDNGNGTFEYHPNHAQLINIIETFKKGESTLVYSNLTGYQCNFTADFTTQGPRTFIAFVNGHVHQDAINDVGTFKNVWLDCAITRFDVDYGTTKEDSINVISVDTTNRLVNVLGFGRSVDRQFKY